MMPYWITILFLLCTSFAACEEVGLFPVLYQGRLRPAEVYAQLALQTPLKKALILLDTQETNYLARLQALKREGVQPLEIEKTLNLEFPPLQRILSASPHFLALPGKTGRWYPLSALKLQVYDPQTNYLTPIHNFTLYSDHDFKLLQENYAHPSLAIHLTHAYHAIAGTAPLFPTLLQLKAEWLYYTYDWIFLLICLYALSFFCLPNFKKIGFLLLLSAFVIHTLLLAWRIFILQRPPVANMYETVLYVPWIATLFAWLFGRNGNFLLMAASFSAALLLTLLKWTGLHHHFNPVQAVLNSQFWLIVHVLLVVASYGLFLLGSVLGHLYLGWKSFSHPPKQLITSLLQAIYCGTACLIAGTLLGGVWAAESWGRFWDWDPKEAWAFVSICIYLAWIHAYRTHHIKEKGLAFGAIIGFLAISFTWYGVNYILGTGLHSYGFGSGGEIYYYLFLFFELFFLSLTYLFLPKTNQIKQ